MQGKAADDDPHGIQALLGLLRSQQDGGIQDLTVASSGSKSTGINQQSRLFVATPGAATRSVSTSRSQDLQNVSFTQALPHLTRLSKSDKFLKALLDLKADQDLFEEALANERKELQAKDNDESQGASDESHNIKLQAWDRQALTRWDNLYARQQERLEFLGVPCFFATQEPTQIQKQQRVFTVLAGLLEG